MRIVALVFAGLGALIVALATWSGIHRRRQERTNQKVRARVVEIVARPNVGKGSTGSMHYPVFEFVAADGRSVRHQSGFGDGTPTHSVGDEIVVWYDRADPERCDIVGEGRGSELLFALMGLVFFTVGTSIFLFG